MADHDDSPTAALASLGVVRLKSMYDDLKRRGDEIREANKYGEIELRRRGLLGGVPVHVPGAKVPIPADPLSLVPQEDLNEAYKRYAAVRSDDLLKLRQQNLEKLDDIGPKLENLAFPVALALDREGQHDEAFDLATRHKYVMTQLMGAWPSDHVVRRFLDTPEYLHNVTLYSYVKNLPQKVDSDLLERVYFHAPPQHRVRVGIHPSLTLNDTQKKKAYLADFWYRYEEEVKAEHFATVKASFAPNDEVARSHVVKDHRGNAGRADLAIAPWLGQHAGRCQQALLGGHSVADKKTVDLTGKSPALIRKTLELAQRDPDHEHVFVRDIKGEKHVLVYRGFGGTYAMKLGVEAGIWDRNDSTGVASQDQDHQPPVKNKRLVLNMAPMSSWTTNHRVAEGFAADRGGIPGQPDGYGMVVRKWMPLNSLLHSGHHQVFHGQTHAHPDEHELVFGHPDGILKLKTSEIFSHQRRDVGEDELDEDGEVLKPAYDFHQLIKSETLAKAWYFGEPLAEDLPGVPGHNIPLDYISRLSDDQKMAAAGNLAKEGNWVAALQVASAVSYNRDAFSRLVQYGIPHQAIGPILDNLDPKGQPGQSAQEAVRSHRQQFLFEMADHLPDDISSDLLHRMWKLAWNDRYSRMRFEEHPNMKRTDLESLGLQQAGEFWKGYEMKVEPVHFAVMHHMLHPESAQSVVDSLTGNEIRRVELVDHRGNKGSSANLDHLFPHLERYASLVQEAVRNEAAEDPDTIRTKDVRGRPHVLVYRGFGGTYAQKLQDALGTSHFNPARAEINRLWPELEGMDLRYLGGSIPAPVMKDPDLERAKRFYPLWHAISDHPHRPAVESRTVVLPTSSFSSWTVDPDVAQRFARDRHIPGQPERRGVVIKKWMPLDHLVHSGFHNVFPGQDHAHPSEFELVFKHPDQKLKVSSRDVHGIQNPDEYDDAEGDFAKPTVLPKVVKLTKGEEPVYHHGTPHHFDTFEPRPGFNTSTLTEAAPIQRHGFFFSDHPEHAREYAGGGRVVSAHLANHESIDLSRFPWSLEESLLNGHVPHDRSAVHHDPEGALERHGLRLLDLRGMRPWQAFDGETGRRFVAALKELGYDSANFKEEHGVEGANPTTHVVFDPGQIHQVGQVIKGERELSKMALKDIGVPTPSDDRRYDYSHLLPDDVRRSGGRIIVWLSAHQGRHLTARYSHNNDYGGEVHGYLDVEGLDIDRSQLVAEHRGRGVGTALYEALMSHAHNALGARYVMGGVHSSMAGKVHEKLGAKHGLDYKPGYKRAVDAPKPHDAARGGYRYALKSEDGLRKDETEEEAFHEDMFRKYREKHDPHLLVYTTPEVIERHLDDLSGQELSRLLISRLPPPLESGEGPEPGIRIQIADRLMTHLSANPDLKGGDDMVLRHAYTLSTYLSPHRLGDLYDRLTDVAGRDPDFDWGNHKVLVDDILARDDRPSDLLPRMMADVTPDKNGRQLRVAYAVMDSGSAGPDDLRAAWKAVVDSKKYASLHVLESFIRNHKTPDDLFGDIATGAHHDGMPFMSDMAVGRTVGNMIEARHLSEDVLRRIDSHLKGMEAAGRRVGSDVPRIAIRKALGVLDPDSVHSEAVGVRMDSARLRMARDLIDMLQPQTREIHPKHLPAGDWSVGRLPNGNIGAEKLQQAIDAIQPQRWNVSHSHWDGAQRHSGEHSKVFQLNITTDQVNQMKAAGVYDTFRKMHLASMQSAHPVTPTTIGWVRYTNSPVSYDGREPGFFVDEVQSDFGQSFVKQAQGQMRQRAEQEGGQMRAQGVPEEQVQAHIRGRMDEVTRRAEVEWPHEHYRKISDILFQGRHPNHILAEAFMQSLRDTEPNPDDVKVGWHSTVTKGPLSNMDMDKPLPGHFKTTYEDVPKRMGMVPSTYGEMSTHDTSADIVNHRTWIGRVRKSEESSDAAA